METKKCNQCLEYKALSEFHNFKASPDGKQYRCKPCHKKSIYKYREQNPEIIQNIEKNRYLKHRDTRLAAGNKYYSENKAKVIESNSKRSRSPEYKEKRKAHYFKNRDEIQKRNKAWRESNKLKLKNRNLLNTYGISLDDLERMKSDQGGRCKICNSKPEMLVVDHCHTSGKVRGLLCNNCNFLLGNAKDNQDTLISAIQYLKGSKRVS